MASKREAIILIVQGRFIISRMFSFNDVVVFIEKNILILVLAIALIVRVIAARPSKSETIGNL